MAMLTKTPTAAQKKEIKDLLAKGDRQGAIDKTIEYYGIDAKNVNGKVKYDSSLTSADADTSPSRDVRIGPSVFQNHSDGYIATTIAHEVSHANQVANHGWPKNAQDVAAYETMGYETGAKNASTAGLANSEETFYKNSRKNNYNALSPGNQKTYDGGQYWGMSP